MIYSYVVKRFEDGAYSGVPRFDNMLRRVFPEMKSVISLPELGPDDVVITDNHLSLQVPPKTRTIVVHHGCARTHYDRDPAWRNPRTRQIVRQQSEMFGRLQAYVAPSWWVADQFAGLIECPGMAAVIPHWVPEIEPRNRPDRPRIIGDWRDYNKGAGIWKRLSMVCDDWDFEPLFFRSEEEKRRQYGNASLYLCLSLSEGGSYSMCDAEAAGLPIVTTDVGNYREFTDCEVIPWQERDNLEIVIAAIERKLARGRKQASFYRGYTFENWAQAWREAIA